MTPAAPEFRILVVEDDLMIASTLEIALETRGYRVLGPVPTIDEAIDLLGTVRPDLALIDYRLAKTTTEALLPVLEAHRVPVCVLTGYDRAQLPAAYAGYAVLEKPFSMKGLLAIVADFVPVP